MYKGKIEFNEYDIAKYPFTIDAIKRLDEIGFTLEDLESVLGGSISERVLERILNAIHKRTITTDTRYLNSDDEIIAYYVAIMVLAVMRDPYLDRVYAVAEAKRAFEYLLHEPLEKIIYISEKTFSWNIKLFTLSNTIYPAIYFTHFISNVPEQRGLWKLANRIILNGYVVVNKNELCRLMESEIKRKILLDIENMRRQLDLYQTTRIIEEIVARVRNEWTPLKKRAEMTISAIAGKEHRYPPCIRRLLQLAREGENLSHAARFALASFLLSIGKSVDDVVAIFSTAPDFNESIARYQVEHIAGLRGSRKKYLPFKCENMRIYGLCYPDELCEKVKHPLQYLRMKVKKNER